MRRARRATRRTLEVGREANGLTQLYREQAGLKLLSAHRLELATGDRIFYRARLDSFPGQGTAFTPLPRGVVNPRAIRARKSRSTSPSARPEATQRLLAAALPLQVGQRLRRDRGRQARDGAEPALARR